MRRSFRSPAHWVPGLVFHHAVTDDGPRVPVSPTPTPVDVSGAGCGFHTPTPLPVGVPVRVAWGVGSAHGPLDRPLPELEGKVVHAEVAGGRAGVTWSEGWNTALGNLVLERASKNLGYVAARLSQTGVELLTAPRRYDLPEVDAEFVAEVELREYLDALANHPHTFPARGGGDTERKELHALLSVGGPREGEVLSSLCHWLGRNIVTVVRARPEAPRALVGACAPLYTVFVQHGPARFLCGQTSVEAGVRLATEAMDLVGWALGSPPPPKREASIKKTIEVLHHQLRTGAPLDAAPLHDHLASRI